MTSDAPDEPGVGRITLEIAANGAITPEFEGVSPYMVPTILRKVANLIEKQLISVP